MARRERSQAGSRPRARAAGAVVPFPRTRPVGRLALARVVPSGRSIAVGLLLLVLGAVGYAAARTTSLFAVERIAVEAPAPVAADVRRALASAHGESLLSLDLEHLRARVETLPTVASATFDRAFPNTLSVTVVAERPVAVLRQGSRSWLASARGRVIGAIPSRTRLALPRIWLGPGVRVQVGGRLAGDPGAAIRALASLAGSSLPLRVASAQAVQGELTMKLRSGLELRLGNAVELPLKLAVVASVVPRLEPQTQYLDVAIPRWPVAGPTLDSQVEVESQGSSTP